MVAQKKVRDLWVGLRKKPKDLCTSESEEHEDGQGVGVYPTRLQSDTVQAYGCVNGDTRPVLDYAKKSKDLSVSVREDRRDGENVSTGDVREGTLCTYAVVCSQKVNHNL